MRNWSALTKPRATCAIRAIRRRSELSGVFTSFNFEHAVQVEKLIVAKAKGHKLTVVPPTALASVVDLMAALKQSIQSKSGPTKTLLHTVPRNVEKKSRKAS
jgi:non-homologous end joining protein Ku